MKYGTIPYVDKPVSRLIFGTSNDLFRKGTDQTEMLDAVLAAGITTMDTGRVYGRAEQVLGDWMEARKCRDRIVILGKGAHPSLPLWRKRVSEKEIRADLETSCEKLKTDFIDIYLLHRDDPEVPAGAILEWMNALHEEGRIGAFGGSNWSHGRLREINEYADTHGLIPFAVSSPHYGLAHQVTDPWGGNCVTITGPENREARDWYRESRMPVAAYSSLANGMFSGKIKGSDTEAAMKKALSREAWKGFGVPENIDRLRRCERMAQEKGCSVSQLALAWMFRQGMDVYAILTSTRPDRMLENIRALDVELTEEECERLAGAELF